MSKFIVRVEIIDLPIADSRRAYDELHKEMEARGFARSCPWASVGEMWLPEATYMLDSGLTSADVGARAKAALSATKHSGRVFVVPTNDGWWASNLLPVQHAGKKSTANDARLA